MEKSGIPDLADLGKVRIIPANVYGAGVSAGSHNNLLDRAARRNLREEARHQPRQRLSRARACDARPPLAPISAPAAEIRGNEGPESDGAHAATIPPIRREVKFPSNGD